MRYTEKIELLPAGGTEWKYNPIVGRKEPVKKKGLFFYAYILPISIERQMAVFGQLKTQAVTCRLKNPLSRCRETVWALTDHACRY